MANDDEPRDALQSAFTFPQLKIDQANDVVESVADGRPPLTTHASEPPDVHRFASPMRHHKRVPSVHREVKETLDAQTEFSSEDADGRTHHRINQYTLLDEIGRGSYGAVHLAVDQFGKEYAVKEFSKVRLRKRAQSVILRKGPRGPMRKLTSSKDNADDALAAHLAGPRGGKKDHDALFLIRQEIAIMKKLDHPNLVQLIEVLDDPEEDSLYMVLEMCKKGVVMKVGLGEKADPYSDKSCRCWFRDLILGIEYLHAQGVIHRDIKPDNLLLSDDEVLKVVDFGVSEIFEKPENMKIAKSAGSPAFLPPELCGKHGEVSGQAADIWSMGVSLYCLKYGKIPFNRDGVLDMYDAIKTDEPQLPEDEDPDFVDLIGRLLEKDPEKRITMEELRNHPWVTYGGRDFLLPAEENCAHLVDPPNELEVSRAFTRKMNHLLCVMKAIHRFKAVLARRRGLSGANSTSSSSTTLRNAQTSFDPAEEKAKAEVIEALVSQRRNFLKNSSGSQGSGDKGHARDVSVQEPLFLGIGTGARDDFAMDKATPDIVAESPTAVDFNVYDQAYENAVEEIKSNSNSNRKPTMYLTKFVKEKEHFKKQEYLVERSGTPTPTSKLSDKESDQDQTEQLRAPASGKLAQMASKLGITDTQGHQDSNGNDILQEEARA